MRTRDATRQRIERVAMLVADGDAAADAVKPLLAKLQGEGKETERLLAAVEGELAAAEMTTDELDGLLKTIAANVAALPSRSPDHQASILGSLAAEVRLGVDHPIGLTLWWDDRVFAQSSSLAPRPGRSTNTRTIRIDVPVQRRRTSASTRGGCCWLITIDC